MPDDVDQSAERGAALLDLGRAKEAEAHFRSALAGDPDSADLHVYLARALHQQERYGEARAAARAGLAADPEHLGGLFVLSASLAGLGRFPAARDAVQRGLRLAPAIPDFHRQEGALLLAEERPEQALESLARARHLDPEDSGTAGLQAAALFTLRRYPEAEEAVADALRLDPDNAEAHRIRGLLSLRRGGGRDAVDAHRQALRLDPSDVGYREGLGLAMKTRNPLYGWLLAYGHWLNGLPGGVRFGFLIAPYLLTKVLRPFDDQLWARVAVIVVIAFVALTWTLEPVMNVVLLCGRRTRTLVPRDARLAAFAFLAYAVGALTAVTVGLTNHSERALVLALGMALWSVSAGMTHTVGRSRRRVAIGLQCAGGVLTIAAVAAALTGSGAAPGLSGVLVVTGAAMTWFTSLA